ncbi:hypothetical protein QJS66_14770 [Kocuria rhizophila]|nr:hypothetical protein QJS66_14770 [Kocuria rhizophila]
MDALTDSPPSSPRSLIEPQPQGQRGRAAEPRGRREAVAEGQRVRRGLLSRLPPRVRAAPGGPADPAEPPGARSLRSFARAHAQWWRGGDPSAQQLSTCSPGWVAPS